MIEALKALWEALNHTMAKYEGKEAEAYKMSEEYKAMMEDVKKKLRVAQEENHALVLEQNEALRIIAEMEEFLKKHG